jgi:hypothetical protein
VEQRSQPFDKPVRLHSPYPTLVFNRASYSLQRDLARMMRVLRGVFSSLCDELLGEVCTYFPSFESLVVGLPDNKLPSMRRAASLGCAPGTDAGVKSLGKSSGTFRIGEMSDDSLRNINKAFVIARRHCP